MTAIQVRKLLSDIAALQRRLQTRAKVIFRGPFEAGANEKRKAAEQLDTGAPAGRNTTFVISTIYEARPKAKRKPNPNPAGASRKKRRR